MADVTTLLNTTMAGMAGNVYKAYIEITDRRKSSISVESPVSAGGGSSVTSVANQAKSAASAAAAAAGVSPGTKKTFEVKFNPSSLHLSGYGGGQVTKTSYTDKTTEVAMADGVLRIGLDVKLLFDKTDPADAFMADKLNLSASAVAANAAKAALNLAGKSDYSVQPEVEAFTAALHSEETREIAFCWGPMRYAGLLERVSARYTMFNTIGQPTRAEVSLSIICVDNELTDGNIPAWISWICFWTGSLRSRGREQRSRVPRIWTAKTAQSRRIQKSGKCQLQEAWNRRPQIQRKADGMRRTRSF
ncbi:MAG: hypothetical protein LUC90_07085 [Lachnospiraceae bacterium]|nr:hypothetical protein [Lachnospiraceae bacterium]